MSILTRDRIEQVVGPGVLADETMAALLDVGAGQPELVEAVAYLEGTDPGETEGTAPPPKVRALADILEAATEWPEDDA